MADYAKLSSPRLRQLYRSPLVALASHWIFQSLLYMDRSERIFKVVLDLILFTVSFVILRFLFPLRTVWPEAFVIAHTANFLFNGHLWGVLKHFDVIHHDWAEFEAYQHRLAKRVSEEPSLSRAAVYGSVVRAEWRPSSDLDVRLVRRLGWWNGLRACTFALLERSRAFLLMFPLDVYVLDDLNGLRRMRPHEEPLSLDETA